jgi:hypothetical protein
LKDASVKAAEGLKVSCPAYQMLTPTGRVEAMEIGCGGQKSKDFECLDLLASHPWVLWCDDVAMV